MRQLMPRPHVKCYKCGSLDSEFICDEGDRFLRKCSKCHTYFYESIIRLVGPFLRRNKNEKL